MVTVRSARPTDVPAIQELWKALMDLHAPLDPFFTRTPTGHAIFGEILTRRLDDADWRVLVAVDGERVVGYGMGHLVAPEPGLVPQRGGHIVDVAVAAAARRAGIGSRLDASLQSWFAERGARRVTLSALMANEASVALWRARGYTPFLTFMSKASESEGRG